MNRSVAIPLASVSSERVRATPRERAYPVYSQAIPAKHAASQPPLVVCFVAVVLVGYAFCFPIRTCRVSEEIYQPRRLLQATVMRLEELVGSSVTRWGVHVGSRAGERRVVPNHAAFHGSDPGPQLGCGL